LFLYFAVSSLLNVHTRLVTTFPMRTVFFPGDQKVNFSPKIKNHLCAFVRTRTSDLPKTDDVCPEHLAVEQLMLKNPH